MSNTQDTRIARRLSLAGLALMSVAALAQAPPDRCLVPAAIRDPILNEYSGEQAYLHVQMLAANRDRRAEEYTGRFFETDYISGEATRSGLSGVDVEYFPAGDVWDAEEADLWLVSPVAKKIASLTMVPTALARGSSSADVETEAVYVGAGREADYAGKDVTGKIVVGNASVGQVFNAAVNVRGAAGALGTGSAGVEADSPGFTLDQLGWSNVTARGGRTGFGFVLSIRQMIELQRYFERGQKVVLRARVRTKTYPQKLNVVSASIPGSDASAGELMIVAHAFETIATPGANDNCSGVGTTLEIARTLARLIRDGALAPPRRTIRFLWVPEISGTRAWLFRHRDVAERLIAAMNYDMTGPDLERTDTYLRMKLTPDSVPSYLNDLVANLLQFVDQTEIRTQTGNNAPFNYRIVPFISNSDHMVFVQSGIPAMQFNHWPDNFYHSSEDRIVNSDPTEMKRVGFMGAAAFYYLATAGPAEARALAWEAAANGEKWLSEVARQSVRLMGTDGAKLSAQYAAALNKVTWACHRGRGAVESTRALSADASVQETVRTLVAGLETARAAQAAKLDQVFRVAAAATGVKPALPAPTPREAELARLVPRKVFAPFSEEMRKLTERPFGAPGVGRRPDVAVESPAGAPRLRLGGLPPLAAAEVSGFIDGTRSVLDIYHAVRAEYGNVTTSNDDYKFAWVVSPDLPDIDLEAVAGAIAALEKSGAVEMRTLEPPRPRKEWLPGAGGDGVTTAAAAGSR
jgi:hypothetical protein